MKKYLSFFILLFLAIPIVNAQTTFDIQLIQVVNDGTNFRIAVQVQGNSLPTAKTVNSSTIEVTYDNSILTFVDATSWVFTLPLGYTRTADNNTTKITLTITGSAVGTVGAGDPPGYDVTSSYTTWVQLNFTHSSPSSTTNMSIISGSVSISLFNNPNNNPNTGANTSYTSSSITLHGLTEQPLPVELSSFTATFNQNAVNLKWQTKTEVDNYGFEVERTSSMTSPSQVWEKIGFIPGNGNSNSPKDYSLTDKNPSGGSKFIYRLKQIDNDGKFEYSKEVEIELVPNEFALYQNYPNPFNPATNIKFALPKAAKVTLLVYNLLGEKVATLLNEDKEAGFYDVQFNASNFSSGVYIFRLTAGDFVQTKKMTLMK